MDEKQQLVDALHELVRHAAETWQAVRTEHVPPPFTVAQFLRELDDATTAYTEARAAYVNAGHVSGVDGAPELKKN